MTMRQLSFEEVQARFPAILITVNELCEKGFEVEWHVEQDGERDWYKIKLSADPGEGFELEVDPEAVEEMVAEWERQGARIEREGDEITAYWDDAPASSR